jgi:ubiquinone/menaquinone biosynthesis C-methylase UbiE
MELNNYDRTAFFYDFVSRLVFSRAQLNAQIEQLPAIPAGSKILIAGGGTGWILEELAKSHLGGLDITYVEISEQMLEKSRRRNIGKNTVTFTRSGMEQFETENVFDVVQTAFLFDNFSPDRIAEVFLKLNQLLKPGGLWLLSDFHYDPGKSPIWQGILLKTMYLFFRILARVEAKRLSDIMPYFESEKYQILSQKHHYRNFIQSIIFKKPAKNPTFPSNL